MQPPRLSLRVLRCPPRGLAWLGAALRWRPVAPAFDIAFSGYFGALAIERDLPGG